MSARDWRIESDTKSNNCFSCCAGNIMQQVTTINQSIKVFSVDNDHHKAIIGGFRPVVRSLKRGVQEILLVEVVVHVSTRNY